MSDESPIVADERIIAIAPRGQGTDTARDTQDRDAAIEYTVEEDDMDIEILNEFLGRCLVINVGVMLLSTIVLVLGGSWASRIHARMFGLDEAQIRLAYFNYLANYKIAVVMLNLAPWIATQLMKG